MKILALFLMLAPAFAATEERKMLAAHEQERWQAVGRLNTTGGFCSAALVGADLVVTAAHCLFTPRTGVRKPESSVHFVAGYRLRKYEGHAKAASFEIHPDYSYSSKVNAMEISSDLALVRLETAIDGVSPFTLAPGLQVGDEVAILSYGRDRPEIPSIQSPCSVRARVQAVAVLDCDVTFGVSGAPVFRRIDGVWRIAGVVSAMGDYRGARSAFAVTLDEAIAPLLASR